MVGAIVEKSAWCDVLFFVGDDLIKAWREHHEEVSDDVEDSKGRLYAPRLCRCVLGLISARDVGREVSKMKAEPQ
jgi:hypothetical protein